MKINRRSFFASSLAMAAISQATQASAGDGVVFDAQTTWEAPPALPPLAERWIESDGARLWCCDTGGAGTPIVLMHPMTGSAASWPHQIPVYALAGYRVIAYSRRGHYRSSPSDPAHPGNAADDLRAVVTALALPRFHLLGCAAGAFVLPDYALAYPDSLRSLTIASSLAGIQDAAFTAAVARLRPPGFADLPPEFKELGPSYRAGNPSGVAAWRALQQSARNSPMVEQATTHTLDWTHIGKIQVPILLMTGDADLYMPPSLLREIAPRFGRSALVIIAEAGHAPAWEQPDAFNRATLDFFREADR